MNDKLVLAARMALLAYSDNPCINGFNVRPFSSSNIQGFSAHDENDLWIVFCGTNDAHDWLDNANITTEDTLFGSVHAGYHNALEMVWGDVLSALIPNSWNCVHIAGHSMGGALAALAAARLIQTGMKTDTLLWTFGQPRCGDGEWAKSMDKAMPRAYTRVFNAGDIVPHLPIAWRFKHAGFPLFFNGDGLPAESTWTNDLLSMVRALIMRRRPSDFHAMDRYFTNVRR